MNPYQQMEENIHKFGVHLMGVFPTKDDGSQPFAYTIGNRARGLPEFLAVGPERSLSWALNELSQRQQATGHPFPTNCDVSLGGQFPVRIVNLPDFVKTKFTIQVGRYYGDEDYRVQQVILPDPEGRFPDDPDCASPYNKQLSAILLG